MDSMEYASRYHPGGYHPVQIGDTFNGGRYVVVQKLGHGTFSTVWLVKDLSTKTYVSLKILVADADERSGTSSSVPRELEVLTYLQQASDGYEEKHIPRLIDSFLHIGPNGAHFCIVSELLGPSLGSDLDDMYPTETFPIAVARAIVREAAYAVQFLHKSGIVHGDLHCGNLLLTSPTLSSLGSDDVATYYGSEPIICSGDSCRGGDSPHVPQYIVVSPDPLPLLQLCLDNPADIGIKICDFGEASIVNKQLQPKNTCIPLVYRAPETILLQPALPDSSADIWALAVLFCFVRGAGFIFPSGFLRQTEDDVLKNIVRRLGKLPEPMWSAWTNRPKFYDDEAKPLEPEADTQFLLHASFTNKEEAALFEHMIRNMLVLDPNERCTIDDVLKSDWFIKFGSRCIS